MSKYQIIVVLIMAVCTYIPRFLPLTFYRRKIRSAYLKSVLYYLPYAVLGALTFPGILNATPRLIESLVGALCCLIFSYQGKGLVFVAVMGIIACYLTHLLLLFI